MPSWGSVPLRCTAAKLQAFRSCDRAFLRTVRPRDLTCLAPWFPRHDTSRFPLRLPDQRVATRPRRMSPSSQLSQSISLLRHVQGSSVARTPSSRLTLLPAGLIPSQRHPWGFSLQRIDFILSRTPLGLPCPSVPWLVAPSYRCRRALRQFGSWSDDSPGFKPAAPGCPTSPVLASRAEPLARHPRRSFCEDRF